MREIRQITVRFNLDNELHQRVWMLLKNMDRKQYKSYSNIVAEAVDAYFLKNDEKLGIDEYRIAEIVRDTVQECFANIISSEILKNIFTNSKSVPQHTPESVSAVESNDIDWDFLGIKNPDIKI